MLTAVACARVSSRADKRYATVAWLRRVRLLEHGEGRAQQRSTLIRRRSADAQDGLPIGCRALDKAAHGSSKGRGGRTLLAQQLLVAQIARRRADADCTQV